MKHRTSIKDTNYFYKYIICVGYGRLQHLLRFQNEKAYTSGVYGWNADIYEVSGVTVICTGYRPFGNIKPSHETLKFYDSKAEQILNETFIGSGYSDYAQLWESQRKRVNELLEEFVTTVTQKN